MTEEMRGEMSPGSVWRARLSRNAPNWVMLEQQEGTHGLLIWEHYSKFLENNYELFHQVDSEIADSEVGPPNLEGIEIALGGTPVFDNRDLVLERRFGDANESLRAAYEANKTQLVEEQKTTAMYVKQRDDILDRYNEMSQKNKQLADLLQDKNSGQLLMFACYSGIVEASSEDSATIVFETDDDVVEHLYEREQFTDGKIPEEGQRVSVCFYLSELQEVEAAELPKDWDTEDDFIDFRSRRKNVVKGPYTI